MVTFSSRSHTTSMLDGGGFNGIWPRVNLCDLNWFSSSWVSLFSREKRLSDVPLAGLLATTEGAPNPVVFPKDGGLELLDWHPIPNAPPPTPALLEEKLNPDAEPNPEEDTGAVEAVELKEKELAEAAEDPPEDEAKPELNPAEEPNPDGGCEGATRPCPNPEEEPNPLLPAAKLKVLAWTGAVLPNPKVRNKTIWISLKQPRNSFLHGRSSTSCMKTTYFLYLCFQRRTYWIQTHCCSKLWNRSSLSTLEVLGCSTLQATGNTMTFIYFCSTFI